MVLSWLRHSLRMVDVVCVLLASSLVVVSATSTAARGVRVSSVESATVTIPSMKLPWGKTLNGTMPSTN